MSTLYVMEHGAVIGKSDERIVVRKGRQTLADLPALHVKQVVVFGNVVFTSPAVDFFIRQGIDVVYLSSKGRFRGRLQPALSANGPLRQQQHLMSQNSSFCLEVSKQFVAGKLNNQLALCKRQQIPLAPFIQTMNKILEQSSIATSLDTLRGYEGIASSAYFQTYAALLDPAWSFTHRNKRPPKDPINALLSLGYTLLYNNVYAAINIVGLDPDCGFYHAPKRGHATLASDLMEEWRSVIVDSLVLQMVNRKQLQPADFREIRGEARLTREGFKQFLASFETVMNRAVAYPPSGEQWSYRRCLEGQARRLVQAIEQGSAHIYRPFQTR